MDWLSKAEKEEVVIQLYKEDKSFREIATLMHMPSAITKKVELQAAREKGYAAEDTQPKSKVQKYRILQYFLICFHTCMIVAKKSRRRYI